MVSEMIVMQACTGPQAHPPSGYATAATVRNVELQCYRVVYTAQIFLCPIEQKSLFHVSCQFDVVLIVCH